VEVESELEESYIELVLGKMIGGPLFSFWECGTESRRI